MINQSSSKNLMRWFIPKNGSLGIIAFILNRITALGLTLYLFMHLVMLSKLAQGPEAYNGFINFAEQPFIKIGEMFVIAGGMIHGLNGIRIATNSFGIGVRYQRQLFIGLMGVALVCIVIFFMKMFI
jgi:succinate dehydrogenase / fumarate reductase, cytochrome b subunit